MRVVQGHPPCAELGSLNRGKSGKSSMPIWNPKPARVLLATTIISALPALGHTVQVPNPNPAETIPIPRAKKRSYQRAVRRAQKHGTTMYRGRRRTTSSLQAEYIGHNPSPPFQRPNVTNSTPRLRVLNYNIGGLSTDAYDELLNHLESLSPSDRPRVVTLQESRWKLDCEYSSARWRVIQPSRDSQEQAAFLLWCRRRW